MKPYTLLLLCLCIYGNSFAQYDILKYRAFFENPPLRTIKMLAEELKNPKWDSIYPITKKEFTEILLKYSVPGEDSTSYGVRFFLNGKEYKTTGNPNTEADLRGVWSLKPECCPDPGLVYVQSQPGKEKEAAEFIKKNKYDILRDTLTEDGYYYYSHLLAGETFQFLQKNTNPYTFIAAVDVGGMEDIAIQKLKSSQLFLYISRQSGALSGEAGMIAKKKYVFGTSTPTSSAGLNFVTSFFKGFYQKRSKVTVQVVTKKDFHYSVMINGPSRQISTSRKNVWEILKVNVWFLSGFNIAGDEMELWLSFEDSKYAKGPDGTPPPRARYTRFSDDESLAEEESDHVASILSAFAAKCRAKISESDF